MDVSYIALFINAKNISIKTNPKKELVSVEIHHLGPDGEPTSSVKTYPVKGNKIMYSERI